MARRARRQFAEQRAFGGAVVTARKICVITSTRAEYGLLFCLLKELQNEADVELQLIATGTHLSEKFGSTVRTIEADGFVISARVAMPTDDDSPLGVTNALASVTAGVGAALNQLQPDMVVVLGDRFEILGAAQAALIARIPIAHIHGGESTEGAIDEAIRHSVTKMAQLHFVAAEEFRQRVIQLGENPQRVWAVGAAGLDNIERLTFLTKTELELELNIAIKHPFFLFTYHPVTLDSARQGSRVVALLDVLAELKGTILITGANADTGSADIRAEIAKFVERHPGDAVLVETLGSRRYLSAMALSDAIIGNSSSGLLEAPVLGVPTVDIGERQRGRLRAPSVIHCSDHADSLREAMSTVLSTEHKAEARLRRTPYGQPGAARKISSIIRSHPLENLVYKKFHSVGNGPSI